MNIQQAVDYLQAQITISEIMGINDPMININYEAMCIVCNYVRENERKKALELIEGVNK